MKYLLLGILAVYRYAISPFLGNNCRFYPSCACYAEEAIAKHGALKGGWLSLKRLLRCHPFHPGGYDPVPPVQEDEVKAKATDKKITDKD